MPAGFHEQPPGFTTLATLGGGGVGWRSSRRRARAAGAASRADAGGAPGSQARPHVRTPDQRTASSCGPAARTATNSPAATDARAAPGRGGRSRRGRRARAGSSTAPPPCMRSLPPRQPVAGRASLIGDPQRRRQRRKPHHRLFAARRHAQLAASPIDHPAIVIGILPRYTPAHS